MIKVIVIGILFLFLFFLYCLIVAAKRADDELEDMYFDDQENNTRKGR